MPSNAPSNTRRSRSRSPPRHGRRPSHRSSSTSSRPARRSSSARGPSRSHSPSQTGSGASRSSTAPEQRDEPEIDYKNAFLALQASNAFQAQRKRKHAGAEKTVSTQALGRGIRMVAALFGEISTIVADAEEYKLEPFPEVDFDENSEDLTSEQLQFLADRRDCERNLTAFQQINRLVPNFQHRLSHGEPEHIVNYYSGLQKGANDSRSDDFGRVSRALGPWADKDRDRPDIRQFDHTGPPRVMEDGSDIRQHAPLLFAERGRRGIEHDICGGLLSTIEHDWSDKDVRFGLREGTLKLNLSFYSRIFYEGFRGDPANVDKGFLKSRYLVKGYKIVFTGPSSGKDEDENAPVEKRARTGRRAIRKPVCDILHMNGKVTGRSIAYICVLEHMSLTTAVHWTTEYYGFSYPQMYNFLVDYFEAPLDGTPEKAHVDALLEWWNRQIFPTHASSSSSHHTAANSMATLHAQRRARFSTE